MTIHSNKALFLVIFIYSSGQRINDSCLHLGSVLLPCQIRQYTLRYNRAVQVTYRIDYSLPLDKHARMQTNKKTKSNHRQLYNHAILVNDTVQTRYSLFLNCCKTHTRIVSHFGVHKRTSF